MNRIQLREFTSWLGKRSYRTRLQRLGIVRIRETARCILPSARRTFTMWRSAAIWNQLLGLLLCDIDAARIASYQAHRKAEGASARHSTRNCRCCGKS